MGSRRREARRPRSRVLLVATLVAAVGAAGCESLTDLDGTVSDVVITVHDEEADFTTYRTFAVPDSVVHLEGDVTLSRAYDELILDQARANMAALGYVEEQNPEVNGADLVLLVAAVGTRSTEWFYNGYDPWLNGWGWWGGWGGYPPAFGGGWGWYWPPGYIGSVTVEQGTLLLTLMDPGAASVEAQQVPLRWGAAIRGLLRDGDASGRIVAGLDQAFAQSPYLGSTLPTASARADR